MRLLLLETSRCRFTRSHVTMRLSMRADAGRVLIYARTRVMRAHGAFAAARFQTDHYHNDDARRMSDIQCSKDARAR